MGFLLIYMPTRKFGNVSNFYNFRLKRFVDHIVDVGERYWITTLKLTYKHIKIDLSPLKFLYKVLEAPEVMTPLLQNKVQSHHSPDKNWVKLHYFLVDLAAAFVVFVKVVSRNEVHFFVKIALEIGLAVNASEIFEHSAPLNHCGALSKVLNFLLQKSFAIFWEKKPEDEFWGPYF